MATCVGFFHNTPPPWPRGNCLTFEKDAAEFSPEPFTFADGVSWRIVNIHAENFYEITRRLGITAVEAAVFHRDFGDRVHLLSREPVQFQTTTVDYGDCVITDERIPREWFRSAPCTACFPNGDGWRYVDAFPDKFSQDR